MVHHAARFATGELGVTTLVMAADAGAARVITVADTGHNAQLDKPSEVAAVIQSLASRPVSRAKRAQSPLLASSRARALAANPARA
jgi:hypothetical protein